MHAIIKGDKERGFDGILVAEFIDDEKISHQLQFDLANWFDERSNGIIGGTHIKILNPEIMSLEFDKDYEFDVETARKVYAILSYNGWKPKELK